MRFFFAHCNIFALIPTVAIGSAPECDCGECEGGGWHIALVWAGFSAGIIFS